jgi:hypothetical protein
MTTIGQQFSLLAQPPPFCEYAAGPCDQIFENTPTSEALFLYPNEPQIIATTIEESARQLRIANSSKRWLTWKDLNVSGQIIFCQVCKALRFTNFAVADVTTLNFNLLFEIGFAIGLGVPVLPIRDSSFLKDESVFSELGLIDTLGYFDFQNASALVKEILSKGRPSQVLPPLQPVDMERPLYVIKSPV